MGRGIVIFVILIAVIFAAGCRGGIQAQAYVEDTHHHHEPEPAPVESDFYPWFLGFEMVDSLGIDSGNYIDYIPELDPYIDDGIVEVYWSVDAVRDYIVEYRINDIPDVQGSRLIDAELCGLGLSCNADGYQFCQYNADFTLMCDVAYPAYEDINSTFDPLDVADMVYDIPETLYFVMQICDTQSDYCESEAIPVLLY